MNNKSVEAVRALRDHQLKTVGEVRQLFGLLSYHRRYIHDFASIAKPLTDILIDNSAAQNFKKNKGKLQNSVPSKRNIQWTQDCTTALKKLIEYVTNPPILAYPDFESEFFVHTDASGSNIITDY